ncbi:MAG: hypothetical protein GY927_11420 [bacterium]|nr:hypothetical protein [bacterium]
MSRFILLAFLTFVLPCSPSVAVELSAHVWGLRGNKGDVRLILFTCSNFLDFEQLNRTADFNFLRIPTKGVAATYNARDLFGPHFSQAATLHLNDLAAHQTVTVVYF